MYNRKTDAELDCGVRVAFKMFGGKWKLCIIDAIQKGITRPAQIHKSISGASRRVIEMQLAELLFFGVVEKCDEDGYPKKSDYKLTPVGLSILPLLQQIDQWGNGQITFVKQRQDELMAMQ